MDLSALDGEVGDVGGVGPNAFAFGALVEFKFLALVGFGLFHLDRAFGVAFGTENVGHELISLEM
jgi:hypothetical protein